MVRILLCNVGVDHVPIGKLDTTLTVDEINSNYSKIKKDEKTPYEICGDTPFIKSYNEIYATEMKKFITENKIDLCVLQELCKKVLPTYDFAEYIAAPYEHNKNTSGEKLMIIGSTNNRYHISPLSNLYGRKYQSNEIMEEPYESILCSKISIDQKYLYVINVHKRMNHISNIIMFYIHLIGMITSIIASDPTANIILCGDNNDFGFSMSSSPTFEASLKEFITQVDTYINPSNPSYRSDLMKNKSYKSLTHPFLLTCIEVLRGLMIDVGFRGCVSPNRDCDIGKTGKRTDISCGRKFRFAYNDVVYYRLPFDSKVSLEERSKNICFFNSAISGHMPYVIDVQIGKSIINRLVPNDLMTLFEKRFEYVDLSSNRSAGLFRSNPPVRDTSVIEYGVRFEAPDITAIHRKKQSTVRTPPPNVAGPKPLSNVQTNVVTPKPTVAPKPTVTPKPPVADTSKPTVPLSYRQALQNKPVSGGSYEDKHIYYKRMYKELLQLQSLMNN